MKFHYMIVTISNMLVLMPQCASAGATVFTSEAAFVAALTGKTQSVIDFNSSPLGDIAGTEFASQGVSFTAEAAGPAGQMEIAPPDFFAPTQYLGIGSRPFGVPVGEGTNDSLDVALVGDWLAVGFTVIDGTIPNSGESITFLGNSANVLYQRSVGDGDVSYIGLLADEPIRRILIVEATDDHDDVGYDDFRLAIPEPSPMSLTLMFAISFVWSMSRR